MQLTRKSIFWLIFLTLFISMVAHKAFSGDDISNSNENDPFFAGVGDLRNVFVNYPDDEQHFSFHRWHHYADFFEINFRHFDWYSRPIRMLEIGVFNGGSGYVWQEYFGKSAGLVYVGIDINPACKISENKEKNIHIEIGSQSDLTFLSSICDEYGPFDIIIDDGSHFTYDILTSFNFLWPTCIQEYGVYAIEDLHTMNLFRHYQEVEGFNNVFKYFGHIMDRRSTYLQLIDHPATPGNPQPSSSYVVPDPHPIADHVLAMHVYDSMIFLHFRKKIPPPKELLRGKRMDVDKIALGQG